MKEWLNEPKNKPIVYIVAGVVMAGAIVFILFNVGVFNGPQPYTPPPGQNSSAMPPPPGPDYVPQPGSPQALAQSAATAGSQPPAGPAPGAPTAPAVPAVIASAPNARKDPFAPYINIDAYLKKLFNQQTIRPRVDTFAPPLTITTYVPPSETPQAATGIQNGQSATPQVAIGRVSGVMLGTGAYAIMDNNGQSLVLQPGDQLPNGAGQLISIQSDSVSVNQNGQIIKVPISSGDNANGGQAPPDNGPANPPGNG
jgi:hypothetical protein